MILRFAIILTGFLARAAMAQTVEYVRPLSQDQPFLTYRQVHNLERTLGELFPLRTLHHTSASPGKFSGEGITYEILKQHGTKYAVVIFSGSWKTEVSQLAIFRIEAGGYPSRIYHSKSWRSNYSDSYHEIQTMQFGRENVILIKEGENGKSRFVVASVFSFREKRGDENTKGFVSINDLTPHLPRLSATVDFPLKPLYGQSIKLEKISDRLILQAADVELSWDINNAPKAIEFWKYDKTSRKFVTAKNVSPIPVITKE